MQGAQMRPEDLSSVVESDEMADADDEQGRARRRRTGPSPSRGRARTAPESGPVPEGDDELLRSREQLQTLSRRLIGAQETERQRIARELHDDIGQALSAVKMNLQSLRRSAGASAIAPQIQESIESVDQALRRVRDLSVTLRPSLLDDLGLVPALRWFLDRQAQRGGFQCRFEADDSIEPPSEVQTACFRIAQEALSNVVRHSGARNVDVALRETDGIISLTVTDDGRGFDVKYAVERIGAEASLGLMGMRERARLLGGRVTVDSAPRKGTIVRARIPVDGTPVR
jgi:signal transduction histidine kinase